MNNKSFEIQNEIRQSALNNFEQLKNLKKWEEEMKQKELETLKLREQQQAEVENQKPIPVRSQVDEFQKFAAHDSLQRLKSMSIDEGDNKVLEEQNDAEARRKEAIEFKDKGNAFVKVKEHEQAIKMYTRAIELDATDPVFFSNRSQCYLSLNKNKECIEDATRAIELDPKHAKSFFRRMSAYEKLGEDYKALKNCRQWMDVAPEDSVAKSSYDRIHNRIAETEKKKDKEKIRWTRFGPRAKNVDFVMRPAHLRSKRPLQKVPVSLRKAPSPIPEFLIDKIFGNNTGETVPEPETDSKLFKPSFLVSPKAVPAQPKESPVKIVVEDKKSINETNEILKTVEVKKEELPTLAELEAQKSHLITVPSSSPQFSAIWKELNESQRFLYLKTISDSEAHLGKLTGALLSSEMLSEIISVIHMYFIHYNLSCLRLLSDLRNNPEISVLVMFLDDEEKKKLDVLLPSLCHGDNADNILIQEIRKFFEV